MLSIRKRPTPAWTGVTNASHKLESRGVRMGTDNISLRRPRWRAARVNAVSKP